MDIGKALVYAGTATAAGHFAGGKIYDMADKALMISGKLSPGNQNLLRVTTKAMVGAAAIVAVAMVWK